MRLVTATLIKLSSDDGLFEVLDEVPLGKKYRVDLDTVEIARGFNTDEMREWKREIIFTDDDQWFPTELLDFRGARRKQE